MRAIAISILACAMLRGTASAQLPGTEIFLAPFSEQGAAPVIGTPVNVTARSGYDNQPWFLDGDAFLYASGDTSGATDVFRYDVPTASRARVTDTPESEYSPTLMPGGTFFSTVRVEQDGAQRLWRFDLDGTSPTVIAPGVDSVGYHAWRDARTVVVFIVGEPHSLRVVDAVDGSETLVALDVGRALGRVGDEIRFMQHEDDDSWVVFRLDAFTGATTPMADALDGSQDCAWTPSGRLLMARDREVFVLADDRWVKVATFTGADAPGGITRMALDPSGRWIAMVAAEPQP